VGGIEHEQVLFCHDPVIDLRGIIAFHSTALGPAVDFVLTEKIIADSVRVPEGFGV